MSEARHERTGPEVIELYPCSTKLSTKFILLKNVKMPTIVGILTFISMINTTSERLKETRVVTMYIFRKIFFFFFKSFVKIELSYVFTINMFSTAENCIEK